jgi:hypothetical protein
MLSKQNRNKQSRSSIFMYESENSVRSEQPKNKEVFYVSQEYLQFFNFVFREEVQNENLEIRQLTKKINYEMEELYKTKFRESLKSKFSKSFVLFDILVLLILKEVNIQKFMNQIIDYVKINENCLVDEMELQANNPTSDCTLDCTLEQTEDVAQFFIDFLMYMYTSSYLRNNAIMYNILRKTYGIVKQGLHFIEFVDSVLYIIQGYVLYLRIYKDAHNLWSDNSFVCELLNIKPKLYDYLQEYIVQNYFYVDQEPKIQYKPNRPAIVLNTKNSTSKTPLSPKSDYYVDDEDD